LVRVEIDWMGKDLGVIDGPGNGFDDVRPVRLGHLLRGAQIEQLDAGRSTALLSMMSFDYALVL
jgi:hypothetical protein